MALEIRQTLRQAQQLVMTPQLQQAIKLLQYNHVEMVGVLERELRENPILESGAGEEAFTDGVTGDTRSDAKSLEDMTKEPEHTENKDVLGVDWESYLETYGRDYTPVRRDGDELPPIEARATYKETLLKDLIEQLRMASLKEFEQRIALDLIGNIDERGYLDIDLETVAQNHDTDTQTVESVLGEIQKFDPPGIGARNLQECLLIQAKRYDPHDDLIIGILRDAFDMFQQGKLERLARKFKVEEEEIREASRTIAAFEPKPGRPYSQDDTVFVTPDIYIVKVGDDYSVELNDDGVPKLKISHFYQNQLIADPSGSNAKDYIQDKMRSAMWLIRSIHQRQRTIYKVTQSILKFQRDFFDKGIDYLKPLVLKDVAADIDMHESTISRVTSNKYVHTPRGVYELKFFFNSGIRHGAESIASESVKKQIERIVKTENPKKPTSDKQIVEMLKKTDIHIARRTVAKYREVLGIPPSSKRRQKY
jgi:RNA polymerase sigma-54 factor